MIDGPSTRFIHTYLSLDGQTRTFKKEVNEECMIKVEDIPKEYLEANYIHVCTNFPDIQLELVKYLKNNSNAKISIDTHEAYVDDPKVLEEIRNYLSEVYNERKYDDEELTMDDFDDLEGDYCERGISYVLYNVIKDKELKVCFADDYCGTPYILYCPTFPWYLKDGEKELSEENVKEEKQVNEAIEIVINKVNQEA